MTIDEWWISHEVWINRFLKILQLRQAFCWLWKEMVMRNSWWNSRKLSHVKEISISNRIKFSMELLIHFMLTCVYASTFQMYNFWTEPSQKILFPRYFPIFVCRVTIEHLLEGWFSICIIDRFWNCEKSFQFFNFTSHLTCHFQRDFIFPHFFLFCCWRGLGCRSGISIWKFYTALTAQHDENIILQKKERDQWLKSFCDALKRHHRIHGNPQNHKIS